MVSASFANEQYRNQGNKATEKRNCYQKVIICFASLFSLSIAAQILRCQGVLFGYSGAILGRLKVSFHCLRQLKICLPYAADLERCDYLDFLPKRPQGTTKILGTSAFAGTKTPAALKFSSKGTTTDCVETSVNCPHCGQKWRLRRRLRRQPFILLSFSSSKKP